MKTIIRTITALAFLAGFAGCGKEDTGSPDRNPVDGTLVTLTADQESTETKAVISSENSKAINWTKDDAITVIDGAGSNVRFALVEGAGTNSGKFQGEVTKPAGSYTALYPYQKDVTASEGALKGVMLKSEQKAVAGSFDPEAALMMGVTETGSTSLNFKNIVGFVKVTPTIPCARITLLSNDASDKLAGTADVTMTDSEPKAAVTANASSSVSISGGIEAGKTYYIAIFPESLSSGFKLVFTDSEGKDSYKSTTKTLEIKRNLVTNLGNVEGTADEYPYVTFSAAGEQTFKMTLADGLSGIEYSVGDADWANVVSDAEVKFGDALGTLRLRGKSQCGTAAYKEGTALILFSQISFSDGNVPVKCTGDIRTLIDWENYGTTSTKDARFRSLFKDCSSLATAPALPATELADNCYLSMFEGCSALTSAPELPATQLAKNSYFKMFSGCTSLKATPALPATELADYCYAYMFMGCTALTEAADLPASHLPPNSYLAMFHKCSSLTIMPQISAISADGFALSNMFNACSSLSDVTDLKVESFSGTNNCQWMFYGCVNMTEAPALPAKSVTEYCYVAMFSGCKKLKKAPELPAETIGKQSYQSMFQYCESLESAPDVLPALKVSEQSYESMFKNCSKLTKAPKISATELGVGCFQNMFSDCTSLSEAPQLPATTLAAKCYLLMFSGCSSLITPPALPATTLAANCYNGMFKDCTSLPRTPALPAKTLSDDCYNQMFGGCTSLTGIPELPATTLARYCYQYMFASCTGLTKAVIPETPVAAGCYSYMFQNCSNLSDVTVKVKSYDTGLRPAPFGEKWLDGVASQGTIHIRSSLTKQMRKCLYYPSGWTLLEDVND